MAFTYFLMGGSSSGSTRVDNQLGGPKLGTLTTEKLQSVGVRKWTDAKAVAA